MLNTNFKRLVVKTMSDSTSGAKDFYLTDMSGNERLGEYDPTYIELSYLSNIGTNKALTTNASTFILGSGTAEATGNDICFASNPTQPVSQDNPSTAIDTTNFSISSASRSFGDNNSKRILQQTWTYSGSSEVTISEIGLAKQVNQKYQTPYDYLFAREVLDSPITVKNGDTFTVSMTIG